MGGSKPESNGANVVHRSGPGRFVTTMILEDLSGARSVWHSRRNRKGLDPEPPHVVSRTLPRHVLVFAPGRVAWWIGILFMIGSALFGLGTIASLLELRIAGSSAWILFTGSIFFTSAAYLQLFEVVNEPSADTGRRPRKALFRWEPHKLGWWAALVQFIGTLFFNINTFEGMRSLGPVAQEVLVWAPNALGSIGFLVASYLAYAEVCRRWAGWQPANISWWVVVINLLGSIAFGASAIAAVVLLPTPDLLSIRQANIYTFVGAVCFFIAAYLLIPEMTAHSKGAPKAWSPSSASSKS